MLSTRVLIQGAQCHLSFKCIFLAFQQPFSLASSEHCPGNSRRESKLLGGADVLVPEYMLQSLLLAHVPPLCERGEGMAVSWDALCQE